ncbi:MAG: NADP-dependent malic enzyme [Candidatus Marsarchaeota archaeon]|nr:NADP-dependent malic enzyme [Candidatus Marsarchaeota archaeon]
MNDRDYVLRKHREHRGKIEVIGKVPVETKEQLSTYYTPGVAQVSVEINAHPETVYEYTNKGNTVAIVSDGTRILGLGDVGPEAGLAVMEGKAVLFKRFGGIDAVPLCIRKGTEDEILGFLRQIEPAFGAINMEDIEAPKVLRIVRQASHTLSIPVFHDDQHGTGVVTLAALMNALRLAGKGRNARVVIVGAGSAGIGISNMLIHAGFRNMLVLDSKGLIYKGRRQDMNEFKEEIAGRTNQKGLRGTLDDAIKGADVFIGASGRPGILRKEHIRAMADKPIVFALTNPSPEIEYEDARKAGAYIVATGRSDTPNQINNVVSFPGIMRGVLEVRAVSVSPGMLYAAAAAIARECRKPSRDNIIPSVVDKGIAIELTENVAAAVAKAAMKEGIARAKRSPSSIRRAVRDSIWRYKRIESGIVR